MRKRCTSHTAKEKSTTRRNDEDYLTAVAYLLKLVDLSDEKVSIATGHLGVCDVNHILLGGKN